MSDTATMIKALRALSYDIQSGDGVANACVADAADMIERMESQLAKANERVKALEQCVIKFRQGVTHFNRTRGDLNVLLSAYADCEQLRKEQE